MYTKPYYILECCSYFTSFKETVSRVLDPLNNKQNFYKKVPALRGIAGIMVWLLYCIAEDHDPALCEHSRDHDYFFPVENIVLDLDLN
jgi:hypothetical protein